MFRYVLGKIHPQAFLKEAKAASNVISEHEQKLIDLGKLYGKKVVYLKFWATWCVPCRQQMPHFEHAYETAGTDMAVIAIDVGFNDSIEAIKAYSFVKTFSLPW